MQSVLVRKVGNSLTITLPVAVIEELGWDEGTRVEMRTMGWAGNLHLIVEECGNSTNAPSVIGE